MDKENDIERAEKWHGKVSQVILHFHRILPVVFCYSGLSSIKVYQWLSFVWLHCVASAAGRQVGRCPDCWEISSIQVKFPTLAATFFLFFSSHSYSGLRFKPWTLTLPKPDMNGLNLLAVLCESHTSVCSVTVMPCIGRVIGRKQQQLSKHSRPIFILRYETLVFHMFVGIFTQSSIYMWALIRAPIISSRCSSSFDTPSCKQDKHRPLLDSSNS